MSPLFRCKNICIKKYILYVGKLKKISKKYQKISKKVFTKNGKM